MTIRAATPADAPGIAQVHVASWRETYAGIVPDAYLASLSAERREPMWREILAKSDGATFVATAPSGEIVGFVNAGSSRSPELPFTGELFAIYLMRAHQKRGLGRGLFTAATAALRQSGHASMMLWVLKDNATLHFYERMGGTAQCEKELEIGGKKLLEVALGWPVLG